MTKREHVWVVDDDRAIRWVLEKALVQVDMQVTSFTHVDRVLKRLVQEVPDAGHRRLELAGTYPTAPSRSPRHHQRRIFTQRQAKEETFL
jgi:hypothetical protein